ncbi:PEP/pyruvate-binding domain-containing protein [Haloferax sp. S1W]|uniref:PEP/pyruvate-binding domain-containing protein n=1 Tax=Haloferax sp. S1W TaxID=3377110 RepID=UPI0037C83B33
MSEATDGTPSEPSQFVIPLGAPAAKQLFLTGGKGANLARLVEAGFRVPAGFCVTTVAYETFVDDPELQQAIRTLDELDPAEADRIAATSETVRSKLQARALPGPVREAIASELERVGANSYAVRSSATAEDLPTASFAGMHDTFLGVSGQSAVLDRVRECVASLFTERAVSYRLRNNVSSAEVAMAVVVQEMVDSEAAGVLFTADPVSGNRNVASVDANYGLGDTVVAGDVSPDSARIDRRTGEVLEYEVGDKTHVLREGSQTAGTELVGLDPEQRTGRVLSNADLRELTSLGEAVEAVLGVPQDIEWALVDDEFVLLQSRPITSLFPIPTPTPDDDLLHVYFSVGHQQAMPEALPPLVVEWWRETLETLTREIRLTGTADPFAVEAGHRVYTDLTPILRITPLRRMVPTGLSAVSEPAAESLTTLLKRRQGLVPERRGLDRLRSIAGVPRRLFPLLASAVPKAAATLIRTFFAGPPTPESVRDRIEAKGEQMAARVRRPESTQKRVRAAFDGTIIESFFGEIVPKVMPLLFAAVISSKALERLVPNATDDIDAISKGFDHEVVTQMNQRLGDLADVARTHPAVSEAVQNEASLSELERVECGAAFGAEFDEFLDEFGHRATNEIDLSRPRWRDDPEPLLRTVRSTIAQREPGAHRDHLERLKREADAAASRLEARAGRGRLGRVRRPLVRRLIEVYRGGIQLREYPKQGVSHFFAAVHDVISDAGESLAADGQLDDSGDVWFLRKNELLAAIDGEPLTDVDIGARRRTFERHAAMTAPPVLTSEGETPTGASDTTRSQYVLTGTPVSAGVVEGTVRVIRDPTEESLDAGDILVAPATDPGWTPLFLNAGGLVMEVGGRMTHGALVAREYGIPAVASVSNATNELRTGERIRLDGGQGTVERLDRDEKGRKE